MSKRILDINMQLRALAAAAANYNGAAVDIGQADRVVAQCRVSAVSGTNPTLDLVIEQSPDGTTGWNTIGEFPQITDATGSGDGTGVYEEYCRPITERYVRVSGTTGGTTPSFTHEVGLAPG